jgi:glycosyltransferase involved in cell wall biosynthesis
VNSGKLKVCYLLSYKQPNYTRTASLVAALEQLPDVELTVIRNTSKGLTRYWQTLSGLVKYRRHNRPDIFIVGFRAQESFWLFYPWLRGSHIIFDEFVNHHDWIVDEHNKFGPFSGFVSFLLNAYMRWVVRRCDYVLTDTESHAELNRRLYRVSPDKVRAVPVGADEEIFKPLAASSGKNKDLEVIFYGNMLPLHGLDVILESIKRVNSQAIHFTIIGGRGKPKMINTITSFIKDNQLAGKVTYHTWIDTEKLPGYVARADVCLGGPFGGTSQAGRVITGKTYQFLAMGKPVVVGENEAGFHFQDKANCIVVKQNDPAALAAALNWCQQHKAELPEIGKRGRELYEQELSIKSISRILENMLGAL